MLERSHLAIIRAVVAKGTLTEAADSLCLSQSALSHAIKKLEHQMGTSIWVKEGRRLRLTESGEYLNILAKRLLPQFEFAEQTMHQYSQGLKGILRIGIECHPCNHWLFKVVAPFLKQWPDVDVDVKQQFQFGGIGALYAHEIDVLITPDPLLKRGLTFTPVFEYELMLVVSKDHPLASEKCVLPQQIVDETLITYPVEVERLDIFSQYLLPANCRPYKHKTFETTEIILQMVLSGRGITALPNWLFDDYAKTMDIQSIQLGKAGVHKQIFVGTRSGDVDPEYVRSFVEISTGHH
ncbi:LysR family transcriptional regulator [Aliikangiella coralliicola]|uniref:HTH-type transcriptional regulator MetR n=1 Tax=Aliikangiella coralliicola TaxID=2592383 RepID=A0A545UGB2_9GAMM|nr:LysR family transcriptional regulator [Aliikangiella coralliicola]TQV88510.1 LysR family transcriptional regulator [Aliikangiella coralliicola]